MKTICFFSGDITRGGGTERVSAMIANALSAQGKYKIIFLSLTEQSNRLFFELNGNIRYYALGNKWLNPGPGYLKVIPKLRRFMSQYQIDVIVDIDIVLDILSIPAARGLGVKVVSWEHFNYDYEMESWYRQGILRYSVKRSDYIVTLTEGDKKTYMERTGRRDCISAIYNPVQEISDCGVSARERWLVTVGHLIKRKGIDYLAQVAGRVLKRFPDWKWLVVGSGEKQAFLQESIRENRLESQLILTGRTDDVGYYLNRAQIYVMTSRLEGLPMCLLEAKSFSLPSVSFDIPTGPNEIIEDGVNGYLIAPFDCGDMAEKLARLMEDDVLRADFAAHAQDNIGKFRLEGILRDWNEVLSRVTSDGEAG